MRADPSHPTFLVTSHLLQGLIVSLWQDPLCTSAGSFNEPLRPLVSLDLAIQLPASAMLLNSAPVSGVSLLIRRSVTQMCFNSLRGAKQRYKITFSSHTFEAFNHAVLSEYRWHRGAPVLFPVLTFVFVCCVSRLGNLVFSNTPLSFHLT